MLYIWTAFFIDLIVGDPQWFPHPVRIIGNYISWFERQVRRLIVTAGKLKACGVVLTLTTVFLTYGVVWGILFLSTRISYGLTAVIHILFLWTCISPRCLQQEALKIYRSLKKNDLELARGQLSYIVGRDTGHLNKEEVVRGVIETVAENTADGVIAPLFYMIIGGAPLAMAYKAINTLDSMVGYKREFYQEFGWCSAKTDDLANYIPARLSAFWLGLASVLLKLDFKNCWRVILRDRHNHSSPNSAYSEAAVAGALQIQLGGSNAYFGKIVSKPTIGDAIVSLNQEQIVIATHLMYGATFLMLLAFTGIRILRGII